MNSIAFIFWAAVLAVLVVGVGWWFLSRASQPRVDQDSQAIICHDIRNIEEFGPTGRPWSSFVRNTQDFAQDNDFGYAARIVASGRVNDESATEYAVNLLFFECGLHSSPPTRPDGLDMQAAAAAVLDNPRPLSTDAPEVESTASPRPTPTAAATPSTVPSPLSASNGIHRLGDLCSTPMLGEFADLVVEVEYADNLEDFRPLVTGVGIVYNRETSADYKAAGPDEILPWGEITIDVRIICGDAGSQNTPSPQLGPTDTSQIFSYGGDAGVLGDPQVLDVVLYFTDNQYVYGWMRFASPTDPPRMQGALATADAPSPAAPIPRPSDCPVGGLNVMREGDGVPTACDSVRQMQLYLVSHGYDIAADGQFGPATTEAVRQFQAAEGLDVDGLVGPATWAKLTE